MADPAAFLDRDGTICEHVPYLSDPAEFELLPTVGEGIRLLNDAGVMVIVTTNQSGIGRGYFTDDDLIAVNEAMVDALARQGAELDGVFVCPHHPDDECACRKPEPGLLVEAATAHDVSLETSFIVGDRAHDLEAGRRVGCRTILFASPETKSDPESIDADYTVDAFVDAAEIIASEAVDERS